MKDIILLFVKLYWLLTPNPPFGCDPNGFSKQLVSAGLWFGGFSPHVFRWESCMASSESSELTVTAIITHMVSAIEETSCNQQISELC